MHILCLPQYFTWLVLPWHSSHVSEIRIVRHFLCDGFYSFPLTNIATGRLSSRRSLNRLYTSSTWTFSAKVKCAFILQMLIIGFEACPPFHWSLARSTEPALSQLRQLPRVVISSALDMTTPCSFAKSLFRSWSSIGLCISSHCNLSKPIDTFVSHPAMSSAMAALPRMCSAIKSPYSVTGIPQTPQLIQGIHDISVHKLLCQPGRCVNVPYWAGRTGSGTHTLLFAPFLLMNCIENVQVSLCAASADAPSYTHTPAINLSPLGPRIL